MPISPPTAFPGCRGGTSFAPVHDTPHGKRAEQAMANKTTTQSDLRDKGDKPPFPDQEQAHPGTEKEMTPDADHGEKSYKGSGKLTGMAALITGADSGIGRGGPGLRP